MWYRRCKKCRTSPNPLRTNVFNLPAPTTIAKPWHTRFALTHPRAYLYAHALAGGALVAAFLWLFVAIADAFPEQGAIARFDTAATTWLQVNGTEPGERIFSVVSWFGAQLLVAAVAVALVVLARRRDWMRVAALAAAAGGGSALNYILKAVFHRGRPEFASEFITHATWSFPSGHAMNSLVGYGFLALLLLEHTRPSTRRTLTIAGTAVLVGLIGYSRVYLGVHFVSDVIGGYMAGAAWLVVCISGYQFARLRLHSAE